MIEHNQIYNEDCLEFMKKLPDNYFDLIITDPPYGIGIGMEWKNCESKASKKKGFNSKILHSKSNWDNSIPTEKCFMEMLRVSKKQIIFGGNYFTDFLSPSGSWIIWHKKGNDKTHFSDCEMAWVSFGNKIRLFKYDWVGFGYLNNKEREKKVHPTHKPTKLGEWILDNYAEKGDLIFDPFSGGGSFLVSCKRRGFEFVGCEINSGYVEIANKRLAQQSVTDFTSATPTFVSQKEFNMGLEVPTSSPPKLSPMEITSPNPNYRQFQKPPR